MGLPSLNVVFKKKAREAIQRSTAGVVLLLLNDSTKEIVVNSYMEFDEVVRGDYTEKNYSYIRLTFLGSPNKVLVVRGAKNSEELDLESSKELIKDLEYDWLAIPEIKNNEVSGFATWFVGNRKRKKNKIKAVLPNCNADLAAIVNFTTDKITTVIDDKKEIFTCAEFCARIAGLLAGTNISESSTYKVFEEVVDVKQSTDPDGDVDAGKFIIIYDGEKFKVGRGVTSLVTVSEEKPEDFKKIKILESMDLIRNDILKTFQDNYVGKRSNNYDNKQLFIGAIMEYFKEIKDIIIEEDYSVELDIKEIKKYLKDKGIDTSKMKEIQLKKANTGSNIFLAIKVKPIDAMEDCMIYVYL